MNHSEDISPYFKELTHDDMNAHRQNNPIGGPEEVTQYISGGGRKSTPKLYIAMKNDKKHRMLVHNDGGERYVKIKGDKIFLKSIRGKYVYV